ncbi:exosome complex component RRP43 [Klebsormidium nitens]|uniref:Ribosomal RNA-processing protein 43 n=1 Tax=Klebsormidium nitens TaxID=105231 RepID=A0A1Y1HPJ3_KLENI|nr:exosome complex component RRP43 [Klebsormidium nitens]|eukprot:GAQ79983.1 exosome complex component RRP43 [Klebsormidium nitens]
MDSQLEAEAFKRIYPEEYFQRFLSEGTRPDGRPLGRARSTTIGFGAVSTADGSALVKIGSTTLLAGIKLEVMTPTAEAPDAGKIAATFEMPPLCSPDARPERRLEETSVVVQQVMNAIESAGLVNTKELLISTGKAAWVAYLDIYCLDADGSLLDAALLAAVAAFADLTLPPVRVNPEGHVLPVLSGAQGGNLRENGDASSEVVTVERRKLTLGAMPWAATIGLYKGHLIVDPTAEEEALLESTVTTILDEAGRLISLFKPGGITAVTTALIQDCVELTRHRARELKQILEESSQEDEDEGDESQ